MNENLSLQMLQRFIGQPVRVDTPLGPVVGVFRGAERSRHRGAGNLLLAGPDGLMLVRLWTAIKRRA